MFDQRPEAYLNLGATSANLGQVDASIDAWKDAIAVIDSPDSKPSDDEVGLQWVDEFRPMALRMSTVFDGNLITVVDGRAV